MGKEEGGSAVEPEDFTLMIPDRVEGDCSVVLCEGARESLREALKGVMRKKERRALVRAVYLQMERRASKEKQLSNQNFPKEGPLPRGAGHFYCFKRKPLRAYCWLSKKHPGTWYVSHFVLKKKDKLAEADTKRVGDNWLLLEDS